MTVDLRRWIYDGRFPTVQWYDGRFTMVADWVGDKPVSKLTFQLHTTDSYKIKI